MGPVRLGVGTEWLLDGRAWRVVRQLSPDRFVAQDTKFHTEQEFSQGELLDHYAAGRLRFASDNASASDREPPSRRPAPVEHLSTTQKRTLHQRWSALEPLTQLGRDPQEDDYAARSAELKRQSRDFSARTLRRYYQAWLRAGKDRMALVPQSTGRAAWLKRAATECCELERGIFGSSRQTVNEVRKFCRPNRDPASAAAPMNAGSRSGLRS